MKKNEITCDLCGVTVAEKEDCFFRIFHTTIPYIKVDYNYIGVDFDGVCDIFLTYAI